jgi:low temperature requirement protein LtrA
MTKTFARIPANAPVMVDANIVVYALFPTASHHESCKNLLERGAQDEIQLHLTVQTAADIIHRAMILELLGQGLFQTSTQQATSMSEHATNSRWIVPMRPRSPHEAHRPATTLELFFDLVFVVAVAQAGLALHHALAEGHITQAIISYFAVFFAIWWAWMNFTWFASAYDCDDVPYRLATFVQLAGALVLAAGVQRAFEDGDYTIVAAGYVVMRLALVTQYLRAGRANPSRWATAVRYAFGVTVCQVGWVALLFFQGMVWHPFAFVALGIVELLVPAWGERAGATSWHPGHIAERYGLFTIIVLGESILATSMGIQTAVTCDSCL